MRHRAALPLTIVLALVTGAIVEATVTVFSAPIPTAVSAGGTQATVGRFYAAVNDVIRTGDPVLLDAVVAADVVWPAVEPGGESGRSGLARRLVALHASQPGLRLVVQELVADRDEAVAWIALEGGNPGALLALPPADPAGLVDGFRIETGRIVEAWGATASLGVPRNLLDVTLDAPAVTAGFVGLSRLTIAPGTDVPEVVAPGPTVVAVETGVLTARLAGAGGVVCHAAGGATGTEDPTVAGQALALTEGDRLTVPAAAPYVLRNDGPTPATALIAAILPPAPTMPTSPENAGTAGEVPAILVIFGPAGNGQDRAAPHWPAGVTVRRLARDVVPLPLGDRVRLGIERLAMAPDARVQEYRPPGPALVAVASGSVMVMYAPVPDRFSAPPVVLQGGQAELAAGVPVTMDGVGAEPVFLLFLTIASPAGDLGSPTE
jgi:hypothetical protein